MRKRALIRRVKGLESRVHKLERQTEPKHRIAHDLHEQVDRLERRFRDLAESAVERVHSS